MQGKRWTARHPISLLVPVPHAEIHRRESNCACMAFSGKAFTVQGMLELGFEGGVCQVDQVETWLAHTVPRAPFSESSGGCSPPGTHLPTRERRLGFVPSLCLPLCMLGGVGLILRSASVSLDACLHCPFESTTSFSPFPFPLSFLSLHLGGFPPLPPSPPFSEFPFPSPCLTASKTTRFVSSLCLCV